MKKLLVVMVACVLGLAIILHEKETVADDMGTTAKAMMLLDVETGKVLYEKDGNTSLPIASLSKLMTQFLVLNAIEKGTLTWESTYEPSVHVQQLIGTTAIVKLGMTPGRSYTVKELFTAMTVVSANDAAIALAELVGGTEESFVRLMNEQAKHLGMKDTIYYNASGLDGNYIGQDREQSNRSSARDVAIISKNLINHHPELLDFTQLTRFKTAAGTTLWSTNLMLPGMPQAMPGIDGLKTGFTDEAGSCFVGTGIFDDRRILSVVIGVEPDGKDTIHPRFNLTRELIERFVIK